MKEITRIETVYDFDELTESAKDNARMKYCESFREPDMFKECCEERIKEDFPNSELQVEFSLSYCQGDGFNVYGKMHIQDAVKYVLDNKADDFDKQEKRFLNYLSQEGFEIKFDCNSRYGYYLNKTMDITYATEDDLEQQYFRSIPYSTISKFARCLNDLLETMCKKYEKEGYDFFYEVEDDEIKDIWEANEYLGWSEDGSPVYC